MIDLKGSSMQSLSHCAGAFFSVFLVCGLLFIDEWKSQDVCLRIGKMM